MKVLLLLTQITSASAKTQRNTHTCDSVHVQIHRHLQNGTHVCLSTHTHISVQLSSVGQSCPTLCDLMDCSIPGFPAHQNHLDLLKLMSIESVMPSNHLIFCRPLLLPCSSFLSIRVFSNKSALCIRCSKYWSFSISLSNEYSGLISFWMD